MIDKIIVYTYKYKVKKHANITLSRPPVDYSTGEELEVGGLWLEGFRSVSGQKAYYNDDLVNITIEKKRFKSIFNPNKIINGDKVGVLTHEQLLDSLRQVEQLINNLGIVVAFDDLQFSRIDLCKDIETIHNFERYIPALNLVSPIYMPNETARIKKGSYLMSNRSRQYNFYDKGAQSSQGDRSKNRVRCEIRFMNKKSVTNSLGLSTLGELKDLSVFNSLSHTYRTILEEDFFRRKLSKIRVDDFDSDVELLQQMKKAHPNKAFDHFLFFKLLTGKSPIQIDDLTAMLKESGYSKTTISVKRKLFQELQKITPAPNSAGRVRFSALLDELYKKLIN
ncbi:hypothetical protein HQ531_05355 [bacterium]|nr:hypothetical protein [bacterium]